MTTILCPFCFEKHDISKSRDCPNFKTYDTNDSIETIPRAFINEYNTVPPLYITAIGFSHHGKTSFIAALTMMLENLSRVWTNSFYRIIDQRTQTFVQNIRKETYLGGVPEKNPVGAPRPRFISLYQLPKFGSNCLVLYDIAGEHYSDFLGLEYSQLPKAINAAQNVWLLISLDDLLRDYSKKINDLLTTYISGMEQTKWSLRGRNLVVIFTKADRIVSDPKYQIPEEIRDYLVDDPLQNIDNYDHDLSNDEFQGLNYLDEYLSKMNNVSIILKDYVQKRVPGGNAFIQLAEMNGLNLRFSIISALGMEPIGGKLAMISPRYRVLDPLFWTLYLNQRPDNQPLTPLLKRSPLKVFLCHAHSDVVMVRDLYNRLKKSNIDVWLDKEKLLPGSDWENEIRKAVREADVVVICLSKNFNQRGFRQKEVRLALDIAMEQPDGEIFIVPARLEECEPLESLKKWHWVDLYQESGYEKLIEALNARAQKVGAILKMIVEQLHIVAYSYSVQAWLQDLQSATGEELSALLPSVLDRAFKGEL